MINMFESYGWEEELEEVEKAVLIRHLRKSNFLQKTI